MTTGTPDVEILCRDISNAEVLCPDGSMLTRCRVFVTNYRVIVWREQQRRPSPYIALECALRDAGSIPSLKATMMRDDRLELNTLDGKVLINKGLGCCAVALAALWAPAKWPDDRSILR